MTIAQTIAQRVQALPVAAQREVLDFVDFLYAKKTSTEVGERDAEWFDLSIASAIRGNRAGRRRVCTGPGEGIE